MNAFKNNLQFIIAARIAHELQAMMQKHEIKPLASALPGLAQVCI